MHRRKLAGPSVSIKVLMTSYRPVRCIRIFGQLILYVIPIAFSYVRRIYILVVIPIPLPFVYLTSPTVRLDNPYIPCLSLLHSHVR